MRASAKKGILGILKMESGIKGETAVNCRRIRGSLRRAGNKLAFAIILPAALTLACARPVEVGISTADGGRPAAATPTPASTQTPTPTPPIAAEEPELDAESWFAARVEDTSKHTAILASLYPGRTIARFNPDNPLNPASLIKLATSLVALKKLGHGHRFAIGIYADGELQDDGTFDGDLYLSGGIPTFNNTSAVVIRETLRARGIEKITRKLHVSPGFNYRHSEQTELSAELLSKELFPNHPPATAVAEKPSGTEIFVLRSNTLDQVLLYQNTLSSNPVAHRVGDAVGGSEGVRRYLVEELGLPPDTVRLETTSGLGDNAMTARGIFAVLRELDRELARQNLKPHDILPVADERRSTLDTRLQGLGLENAISGKTGTLSAADGGVGMASLAGYINTTSGERLAFVLMDEGPYFHLHRQLQHDFLLDALTGRIDPQPVEIERPRDPLPGSALEIEERADLPRVPSKNRATRSRL